MDGSVGSGLFQGQLFGQGQTSQPPSQLLAFARTMETIAQVLSSAPDPAGALNDLNSRIAEWGAAQAAPPQFVPVNV